MKKLKELLVEHKIALVLAVLTSLVIAFPQVYFRIDHPEFYQEGIEAIELLPDAPWSARVREVQDGHPSWGNIYFKDGKDDPYLFQPLGSMIVAYSGMLFGFNINNTMLLSRILFPFAAFLIMYSFVFSISRSKLAALSSISVILLAEPVLRPSGLIEWLNGDILNGLTTMNFLELARPVNSAMIFIFLFGFFVAFWQYYRTGKWQWGVASAILLGLNFYNYFYSWTFMFSFGGVLYLILLMQKKWGEIMKLVYVFLGGLIVALPYIWNLYSVTIHPNYEQLASRHGVIVSYEPEWIGVVAFVAIVLFIVAYPRQDKQKYIFGLSILLAPIIALNQQLITGKVLQVAHYHWYANKPMALIFATIIFFYFLDRLNIKPQYQRLMAGLIISAAFTVGFTTQALSYKSDKYPNQVGGQVAIEKQKYAPVMAWLNAHAEKEAVVFANEDASHVTVVYTPLNVFHHRSDQLMLAATDQRLEDIVFAFYRLRGVDSENVQRVFDAEKASLSSNLFGIHYRERKPGAAYSDIPDEVYSEVIKKYKATLEVETDTWLFEVLKKYEVEYLIWDRVVDPDWQVEALPFLAESARFGNLVIYRFDPQGTPAGSAGQ